MTVSVTASISLVHHNKVMEEMKQKYGEGVEGIMSLDTGHVEIKFGGRVVETYDEKRTSRERVWEYL